MPSRDGAVPVEQIAFALDIIDIRLEVTKSLEAALVTTEERGEGAILLNSNSSVRRRRFSVGHELLHFLNPIHRPTIPGSRFACTEQDLRRYGQTASRHARQEAEANRFAIELLAPPALVRAFLAGPPDLAWVAEMSSELMLSREACVRRYVELHEHPVAAVFSHNGMVRYSAQNAAFPYLPLHRGRPTLLAAHVGPVPPMSEIVPVDPAQWLKPMRASLGELNAQTLRQQDGYAITLLTLGSPAPGQRLAG